MQERLREGADDRGDSHRHIPAPVVPLDAVAGRELVLGCALAGLDAVDEVEPVALPGRTLALEAIDGLHETSAEPRVDVELGAQHSHHGLALSHVCDAGGANGGVTEVTRDPDGRPAARALLTLAESAAGRRRNTADENDRDEQRADTPHGTSTRSANERTSPAFVATTR